MTQGGAESVLKWVGGESSMETANSFALTEGNGIARPGGASGYVGVPHGSGHNFNLSRLFVQNITSRGGVAPARAYIPELLADTVAGKLNASAVLDLTVNLDGVPSGYAAMDGREAIKVMVRL